MYVRGEYRIRLTILCYILIFVSTILSMFFMHRPLPAHVQIEGHS